MNNLIVNKKTKKLIENFISNPSHAVILLGLEGVGKQAISDEIATSLLTINAENLNQYPYLKKIAPIEGKDIGIDSIRNLDHFLSLKVPTKSNINRVVQIENSQLLTIEAQNALLKMLEEPPSGTLFILTATHSQSLLPTVISRAQIIDIIKPTYDEVYSYYKELQYSNNEIETALKVSGGLPGLMTGILKEKEHPLIKATEMARKILSHNLHNRLLLVDELSKNKQLALDTLYIFKQMAHLSLLNNSDPKKWHKIMDASYEASDAISSNGQLKLALDRLMLSLT